MLPNGDVSHGPQPTALPARMAKAKAVLDASSEGGGLWGGKGWGAEEGGGEA